MDSFNQARTYSGAGVLAATSRASCTMSVVLMFLRVRSGGTAVGRRLRAVSFSHCKKALVARLYRPQLPGGGVDDVESAMMDNLVRLRFGQVEGDECYRKRKIDTVEAGVAVAKEAARKKQRHKLRDPVLVAIYGERTSFTCRSGNLHRQRFFCQLLLAQFLFH